MPRRSHHPRSLHSWGTAVYAGLLLSAAVAVGCGGTDEVASVAIVGLQVDNPRVALGGPVEFTYRFEVLPDAPPFAEDYRVFLHVLDPDGSLIFDDDHDPPIPTSEWAPGRVVEYTRTIFYPIYPYLGRADLEIGLYSRISGDRVPLQGDETGQRAYRVGAIELRPQTENVSIAYAEGWHDAEVSGEREAIEWRWTEGRAAATFPNPSSDLVIYLNADQPAQYIERQTVTVRAGDQVVDEFTISPGPAELRKIPVSAAQLGDTDPVTLTLEVAPSFVPAEVAGSGSDDPRELGLRVFNLHVELR